MTTANAAAPAPPRSRIRVDVRPDRGSVRIEEADLKSSRFDLDLPLLRTYDSVNGIGANPGMGNGWTTPQTMDISEDGEGNTSLNDGQEIIGWSQCGCPPDNPEYCPIYEDDCEPY
jgi:hypothetical protein